MKKIALNLILLVVSLLSFSQNCPSSIASESLTSVHFVVNSNECNKYPETIIIDDVICDFLICDGNNLKYTASKMLSSTNTFMVDFGNNVICTYVNGVIVPLSKNSRPIQETITVFPNPITSGNLLNINLKTEKDVEIELYSIIGKLIYSKSSSKLMINTINIGHLKNGVYLLRIKTDNTLISKKIAISK